MDVGPHDVACASKMRVRALALAGDHLLDFAVDRDRWGCDRQGWIRQLAPAIGTRPVVGVAVVLRELDLALPIDRAVGLDRRAVAHLLLCSGSSAPGEN